MAPEDNKKNQKRIDTIKAPKKSSYMDLTEDFFNEAEKPAISVRKETSSVPKPQSLGGKSEVIKKQPITFTPPVKPKENKGGFFSSVFGPQQTPAEIAKKKEQDRIKLEAQKREEEAKRTYEKGLASIRDIIAPSSVQITPNYIVLNDTYIRTIFVFNYPRYIFPNWMSPLINIDQAFDIGMFIYPRETRGVLDTLKKRSGQVEAALTVEIEKGMVRNPELETALQDIEELRDRLSRGEEKLFHFSLYITFYAKSLEDLDLVVKKAEAMLGGVLVYTKRAGFQMDQGFRSTLPLAQDLLDVPRNMNTGALSTAFPFSSMDLTSDQGIMYGVNRHNNSLVIFDRFKLENANAVVFAKSGGGKSFAVKLEALRYMMLGTDVIIIDPENEYKNLCKVVGGSFLNMSLSSDDRINPFDVPPLPEGADEGMGEDNLRTTLITLKGLMNLLVGMMSVDEDAIMERALMEVYTVKGITSDPASQKKPAPLMSDLYEVLKKLPGSESLVKRLDKYVTGTFSNFFNKPTNIDLDKGFVVFNIRDLEPSFRPIAMYMVLDFIWAKIRQTMKRRLLIIDEAWLLMEHEDAAKFIFSIAKRARKYYLGMTTISQDVEDFLGNKYGRAIITNSSMQLLLRQSPASIESVGKTFNLTQAERSLLLESEVGQGLFFAGLNHVAIAIIASYTEYQIVNTSPKQGSESVDLDEEM